MENVTPIRLGSSSPRADGRAPSQVVFNRQELATILNIYGRGVAAGVWRDYAIAMDADQAVFSLFQRTSERPETQIIKRPENARKQGQYALLGQGGVLLKRGQELGNLIRLLERKLMKVVDW